MTPVSEIELAEAIRDARGPVVIVGGGTRPLGPPRDGVPIFTGGLRGVTLYEPGALTLVAKAGTPLAEIDALLASEGQRLAFEPMDHRPLLGTEGEPTLGGMAAANVSGPRRIQAGACRDSMIGVRFVNGAGTVVKNGGRVMKNVTGLDLVKLMAGSRGTLGVLTEVSLKVQALPQAEATVIARGLSPAAGVAALCSALGSPYDVSGAAHLEAGVSSDTAETRLRVEGMSRSVAHRAAALLQRLGAGWFVVEGTESAALWREVRDVLPFARRAGAVWRVSVRPTDGPRLAAALRADGLGMAALYDWGGGLVWLLVPDEGDGGAVAVRGQVSRLGGHATLVRGSEALRRRVEALHPEPEPVAAISRGLRARFDPRGIFGAAIPA